MTTWAIDTVENITARMIAYFLAHADTGIPYDFSVGSVLRSEMEAAAGEIQRLYVKTHTGLMSTVTAGIYQSFGHTRRPATRGYGDIVFSGDPPAADVTIAKGKRVRVPGTDKVFETTQAAVWATGQNSVTVRVAALQPGKAFGNTSANTITEIMSPIAGVSGLSVTNPKALTAALDTETDAGRMLRFKQYIESLHRGNEGAIEWCVNETKLYDADGFVTEYVASCYIVMPNPGYLEVYIWNGQGDTSAALLAEVEKRLEGYVDEETGQKIPGYKAAGIPIDVYPAPEQEQNVAVEISVIDGYEPGTVQAAVQATIETLFTELKVSGPLDHHRLTKRIMEVPGVETIESLSPTTTVTPPEGTVLIPGTISVTVEE